MPNLTLIPKHIYKAKDCKDISDVEIAIQQLHEYVYIFFGKQHPTLYPVSRRRLLSLEKRKKYFLTKKG